MKNTIKCPKCGEEIEVSAAMEHQIEERVISSTKLKLQEEADKKANEKFESQFSSLQKENIEDKERNKKLTDQISEMLDEIRSLKTKDEERDIEMKKKIMEGEEKIRIEVRKKAEEDHQLKDLEKEKLINDLKKSLEDAQRKATQGSQQTQGETLELTLESKLKSEFPNDIISEVKKGQRGADIIQEVVDKLGRKCGVILWESKNAQWSDGWIEKLKEDQRQAKADIAILISVNLPEDIDNFAYRNGIWVCSLSSFIALALAMRFNLVSIYHEKQTAVGVDEKMKVLYEYLTGNEFKHRVEGIVEAFASMQDDLEKEKRWFSVKWARQEKEIRKVMDHTHGMYGDLQGVIGKSLPEISSLELPEAE
jgi:hypothetical protein